LDGVPLVGVTFGDARLRNAARSGEGWGAAAAPSGIMEPIIAFVPSNLRDQTAIGNANFGF
jgi:hypothetical protein